MRIEGRGSEEFVADRDGFVLPVVLFALLIMSAVAVASLITAGDEQLSSRAVREANNAFYAAEAGLNEAWRSWDTTAVRGLEPGQVLDLGWRTLGSGGRYNAQVRRVDNGGQPVYWLLVEGRGRGGARAAGSRVLTLALTEAAPTSAYRRTAALVRGNVEFGADNRNWGPDCGWGCRTNGLPWIDGSDAVPASWTSADCGPDYAPEDGDALVIKDTLQLDTNPQNDDFHQSPNPASESIEDPVIEMPDMTTSTLNEFAGVTREELIAMADHTFPDWSTMEDLANARRTTYPTLNPDGTCDTSDPYNWGSPDPTHPCYNHHPIVYLPAGAEIRGAAPNGSCGYGQAILIADGPVKLGHHDCDGGQSGANPNEEPYEFDGIAMVRGCLELVYATRFNGTAIVDDDMSGAVSADCDVSGDFDGNGLISNQNGTFQFSSCAIDKALRANGIDPRVAGDFTRLHSRSFNEPLR